MGDNEVEFLPNHKGVWADRKMLAKSASQPESSRAVGGNRRSEGSAGMVKFPKLRWLILGALFLSTEINYLSRLSFLSSPESCSPNSR